MGTNNLNQSKALKNAVMTLILLSVYIADAGSHGDHIVLLSFKAKMGGPKGNKKKFIMYIGAINNYPDNQ